MCVGELVCRCWREGAFGEEGHSTYDHTIASNAPNHGLALLVVLGGLRRLVLWVSCDGCVSVCGTERTLTTQEHTTSHSTPAPALHTCAFTTTEGLPTVGRRRGSPRPMETGAGKHEAVRCATALFIWFERSMLENHYSNFLLRSTRVPVLNTAPLASLTKKNTQASETQTG